MVKAGASTELGLPLSPPDCIPAGSGNATVDQDGVHAFADGDATMVGCALPDGAEALEHDASPAAGNSSATALMSVRTRRRL